MEIKRTATPASFITLRESRDGTELGTVQNFAFTSDSLAEEEINFWKRQYQLVYMGGNVWVQEQAATRNRIVMTKTFGTLYTVAE